ncbi:MAG: hypothetical protein KatS3mg046_015 [Bellilinea sp.]|nr:MAG: hypothetical protein KatS3mg046_015 [Bellilinea sp.]
MDNELVWFEKNGSWLLPFTYFFSRIVLFLALIPTSYYGFGDLPVYYEWTSLPGWPYINYWVEYPPLFPFLSEVVFQLTNGQIFLYDFIICLIIALAGAGTIAIFQKISVDIYNENLGRAKTLIFFGILSILPYTWWYAELITVFFMMSSLWFVLKNRYTYASIGISLGILTKWFPIFLFPAIFRFYPTKRFLKLLVFSTTVVILVFGILFVFSPEMTLASLRAQPNRSSWQTLWALLDNNLTTGTFLNTDDRLFPEIAGIPRGNPPLISPNFTFLIFGGIGVFALLKRNRFDPLSLISFLGFTWTLFLLWSPGWSPQWILYLIPLLLLSLPISQAFLISITLVLLTIIEWPFMLTRHLFVSLWLIVPIRMVIFSTMIVLWFPYIFSKQK